MFVYELLKDLKGLEGRIIFNFAVRYLIMCACAGVAGAETATADAAPAASVADAPRPVPPLVKRNLLLRHSKNRKPLKRTPKAVRI